MAEKKESIRWKASPQNRIGSLSLINISFEGGGGIFKYFLHIVCFLLQVLLVKVIDPISSLSGPFDAERS